MATKKKADYPVRRGLPLVRLDDQDAGLPGMPQVDQPEGARRAEAVNLE